MPKTAEEITAEALAVEEQVAMADTLEPSIDAEPEATSESVEELGTKPESAPEPALTPEPTPTPTSIPITEPTEPTEAERLAADNQLLREELNEQARRIGTPSPVVPVAAVAPAPEPATAIAIPGTPIEFITADEAENLIDKPQAVLNAVLNKVYQAGRESVMREMPTLVRQQTLTEVTLQQRVQGFWVKNNDLKPYQDFCAMVARQVEVENPGLAFDAVLEKTGEIARERLKLPKTAESTGDPEPAPEPAPSTRPALPTGVRAARKPAVQPSALGGEQKEMEDILTY